MVHGDLLDESKINGCANVKIIHPVIIGSGVVNSVLHILDIVLHIGKCGGGLG